MHIPSPPPAPVYLPQVRDPLIFHHRRSQCDSVVQPDNSGPLGGRPGTVVAVPAGHCCATLHVLLLHRFHQPPPLFRTFVFLHTFVFLCAFVFLRFLAFLHFCSSILLWYSPPPPFRALFCRLQNCQHCETANLNPFSSVSFSAETMPCPTCNISYMFLGRSKRIYKFPLF